MKKSKFCEEQTTYALRGVGAAGHAPRCAASERQRTALLYLEKEYAHLGVSEPRHLRSLEEENQRLKKPMADDMWPTLSSVLGLLTIRSKDLAQASMRFAQSSFESTPLRTGAMAAMTLLSLGRRSTDHSVTFTRAESQAR
jgi:hypothetical protein